MSGQTTSTVFGPQVITSTNTVSTVTSTSTINSGPTVSAFALMDGASGNYAASNSDVLHFSYNAASEGALTLDSNGNLAQGTGIYPGNKGWQMISQTPDFIRFGNPANYGVSYNYVTCTIQSSGGSCSLVCSVNGQTQNCLYNYPNDSRDGSWILGVATGLCQSVSPPLIKPLAASSYS
jgi:hypothetical protein